MYFKLLLFSLFLLIGCQSPYELFVENFDKNISTKARKKCEEKNPNAKIGCDIKRCISSPITLLALEDLLISVDRALKKLKIPYVLDGGTHVGQARFRAPLPWDDDADISVLATYFPESKQIELKKILKKEGLEFAPFHTVMDLLGNDGLYQISYAKSRYFSLVKQYKKDISDADLENLWQKYDSMGRHFPHLDIFVWDEVSPGKITYQAKIFAKGLKNGSIEKEIVFPKIENPVKFLGGTYSGMGDFIGFSDSYFNTKNIVTDFVIYPDHKIHADCPKIRLKNINEHPEIRDFYNDYLKFVFKKRYDGPSKELELTRH